MLPHEPQVVIFYYAQLAQDLMDRGMDANKASRPIAPTTPRPKTSSTCR
jgi:hypothetical protein